MPSCCQKQFAFVAVAAVLERLDIILTLKEVQRMTLKAFESGKDVFGLIPSLVKKKKEEVHSS